MKTRKSVTKRLKITRKGKILARKVGQNHFRAKESRTKQLDKKRTARFTVTHKRFSSYLSIK